MPTGALETLTDPLISPILALMQDAVNAELAPLASAADGDGRPFVKSVAPRPFVLEELGEDVLPALYCFRVRSRTRQTTFVHRDHLATLQFQYVTPAVAQNLIDERWPVLDRVWRVAQRALNKGHHVAHQNDARVLEAVKVIRVDLSTALKREAFVGADQPYPMFIAEIDVTWRDGAESDHGALYPALSFDARVYADANTSGTPDVVGRALTPAGEDDPEGREFERPSDWSL